MSSRLRRTSGNEPELLALAAAVEAASEHPLAAAVLDHARELGAEIAQIEEFRAMPGRGAVGRVGAREVAVGNHRLMRELGIEAEQAGGVRDEAATGVLVAVDGTLAGVIWTADELKPGAAEAVAQLRRMRACVCCSSRATPTRSRGRSVPR